MEIEINSHMEMQILMFFSIQYILSTQLHKLRWDVCINFLICDSREVETSHHWKTTEAH